MIVKEENLPILMGLAQRELTTKLDLLVPPVVIEKMKKYKTNIMGTIKYTTIIHEKNNISSIPREIIVKKAVER